jgi:hypothetical protein
MAHKCEGCKYFYLGDLEEQIMFYNALAEVYETGIKTLVDEPCCGISAGGAKIDVKQPRCINFEAVPVPKVSKRGRKCK